MPSRREEVRIPAWLLDLPPDLLRKLHRLAQKRGVSEADLLDRALHLVSEDATGQKQGDQEKVTLPYFGVVSVDLARKIQSAISSYFGKRTKTKLDAQGRKQRAQTAATERWRKEREKRNSRQ